MRHSDRYSNTRVSVSGDTEERSCAIRPIVEQVPVDADASDLLHVPHRGRTSPTSVTGGSGVRELVIYHGMKQILEIRAEGIAGLPYRFDMLEEELGFHVACDAATIEVTDARPRGPSSGS